MMKKPVSDIPLRVSSPTQNKGMNLKRIFGAREVGVLLVILVVFLFLSFRTNSFLSWANLSAVSIALVTDAVIAIGMTMVLITGGFDLSVGSVLALSGMVVAILLHSGMGIVPAILITLLVAIIVGLVNGFIISIVGVNPLITTLGMMGIASGITLVISGGYPVSNLPKDFLFIGQGYIFSIPFAVLVILVMLVVADILLRRARWLRLLYYIGGNQRAARLSGIQVNKVRIAVYMLCAALAGVAGIIATSRLGSSFPLAGKGTELRVISACVIGGCSLQGGEGTIFGALLGVLLLAIINNGLVLLSISINWQSIISGAILISAVTFDLLNQRRAQA